MRIATVSIFGLIGLLTAAPARADDSAAGVFRNQVQPIMAKFGCSSGACHGAAAGKNGFRLSLRGYDDEGDWKALTRHSLGRRIVPADPSASLLLRKPTGALPHKGGVKFSPDSREFQVLAQWIAAGAPGPSDDDPRIDRIELLPERITLAPGAEQQLTVRAHFSDGSVHDVTQWAKYTSANTSVVNVDDATGKISVVGHGEGAITAWYLSKIAIATIASPYPNEVPDSAFAQAPRRNFIDEIVLEKLQELKLPPSPPATDAQFMRRAYLDTLGILPTAQEARNFLADTTTDKRDRLIEELLTRPEFVDYWSYKWSDLLLVNSFTLPKPLMWSYYNWIRGQVAANTPWDKFVRQLVTAKGSVMENGAGSFFLLHDEPTEMSENVSVAFLGMSINCAKCHNHPMEKWTNDQYFAMANLFGRVRSKDGGGGDQIIFSADSGDVIQALRGKPQPPTPLDGTPLALDHPGDRREHLADWLVAPQNPYFTASIVNRVWANFMGVGLVEAVDDMRKTNPPSNEKLLEALSAHLVEQQYDLKALMRTILQSQTYQRSSDALPGNADDTRFYSRYYPKRLMAEVALDALSQVTGVPTQFVRDGRNALQAGEPYPMGYRAIQLPDSNTISYFLEAFGRPERLATCTCERTDEPSMAQALHIANGDTLNQKLQAPDNVIARLLAAGAPDEKIVEEAYLGALSRYPTDAEKQALLAELASAAGDEKRLLTEDLYWGILSSKEFLFNH